MTVVAPDALSVPSELLPVDAAPFVLIFKVVWSASSVIVVASPLLVFNVNVLEVGVVKAPAVSVIVVLVPAMFSVFNAPELMVAPAELSILTVVIVPAAVADAEFASVTVTVPLVTPTLPVTAAAPSVLTRLEAPAPVPPRVKSVTFELAVELVATAVTPVKLPVLHPVNVPEYAPWLAPAPIEPPPVVAPLARLANAAATDAAVLPEPPSVHVKPAMVNV